MRREQQIQIKRFELHFHNPLAVLVYFFLFENTDNGNTDNNLESLYTFLRR
jgi:hypothetical protein